MRRNRDSSPANQPSVPLRGCDGCKRACSGSLPDRECDRARLPKVGVKSLDWSTAPKVRRDTSPGQRPGFLSAKDTRAEGPIHRRRVKKMVQAFSPPNPTFPSTQAVGLGWYCAAPSVLSRSGCGRAKSPCWRHGFSAVPHTLPRESGFSH
jgi:hypothetical protein